MKENCQHEYGHYRPNTEPGPVLVCSECGIELDVITRRPKDEKEKPK
jgi:hypothetical protein